MDVTLQTLQKYAKNGRTIDIGKNDGNRVFYWFGELLPYSWADDIAGGPDHRGWFTNEDGTTYKDGSGKARGFVVELPAIPGFSDGRFLAGYWWGDNGEFVLWPELYKDKSEAACAADEHARAFAESAREDSARYEAMRLAEIDCEEKLLELQKAIALRHSAKFGGFESVRDAIGELRTARRELVEATAAWERV